MLTLIEKKAPPLHRAPRQIGRGKYVHAPRLRDKAKNPKWMANAAINNPGNVAATGAIGGGSLLLLDKEVRKADDREKKVVGGAAVGAGAGQLARVGADYGTKEVAERQLAPYNAKGKGWNYGPYKEGWEHKPLMNKYKRTAKGDPRQKAKMFDENFPKGVPSYRARKLGTLLNKPKVVAGAAVGGAALGATAGSRKVKKNDTTSAFGVDHG